MSAPEDFDLLAKAKAHFRDQITGASLEIEVPEWGLSFHVRPPTLKERARMLELTRARGVGSFAEIVVLRARTAAGVPMFQAAQVGELEGQVDAGVLEVVGTKILNFDTKLMEARTQGGTVGELEGARGN